MNYDDLTKEALVEILKRRDAQAHYGLHWERHAIERDKALNRDFVDRMPRGTQVGHG